MSPPRILAFAGVLVVLISQPAGAVEPLYSLIDMGHASGYIELVPAGINSSGYVVGSVGSGSNSRGFVWNPNTHVTTLLGNLGSRAAGINDSGIVVGNDSVNFASRPYRYNIQTGVMTYMNPLPGGSSADAFAVNASGAVTGLCLNAINQYRAPLWAAGSDTPIDLGALPGDGRYSMGRAINAAGVVVGQSKPGNYVVPVYATRWDPITHEVLSLGTLPGGFNSTAYAINNAGFIAGSSSADTTSHPFLWSPTTHVMTDMGILPGSSRATAYAMNDFNTVVGISGFNLGDPLNRAFLWTSQTGMVNLNTLTDASAAGWVLNLAQGINNAGWITGYGRAPDGHQHGFVLVPVPEPAALSLLLIGALVVRGGFRRSPGHRTTGAKNRTSFLENHPTSIVSVDLEADGDDDLVVGFNRGNTVTVLTCLGRGRFAQMTLPSGTRPRFVTAGDVDGNGLTDILEVGGIDNPESHLRVIFSNCGGM